jgi:hypothetical protein
MLRRGELESKRMIERVVGGAGIKDDFVAPGLSGNIKNVLNHAFSESISSQTRMNDHIFHVADGSTSMKKLGFEKESAESH